MALDLTGDPAALTAALIDIPSVSGDEQQIADEVEQALRALDRYEVVRRGNSVLARTALGLPGRVLLAGHLDTVPIAGNVPSRTERDEAGTEIIHGCGSTDMKSGDAMLLHLAATVTAPAYDLTFVFYECEEVDHDRNGLTHLERDLPAWLDADLAVLGEPTDGLVEAGCQGTLSFTVTTRGTRAHSARSWMGHNAIHDVAGVLAAVAAFDVRTVDIDGCTFREGLNAVRISGGVAGNVIPDECTVQLNFRYAPDRSAADAAAAVQQHFSDYEVAIADNAAGALPGLDRPAAAAFVAAAGGTAKGKLGWTDVARFAARGTAAVNYGPGDPMLAHTRDERVAAEQVREMTERLRTFLVTPDTAG